jgi:hypothetical protein
LGLAVRLHNTTSETDPPPPNSPTNQHQQPLRIPARLATGSPASSRSSSRRWPRS